MRFYGDSERWWRALLLGDNPALPFRRLRRIFTALPSSPRCKFCHAPFHGLAGPAMRLIGKSPSRLTPELCLQCEAFARRVVGGAEIELSMLFADVRGSTSLAEGMSPTEFGQLINRFFAAATDALVSTHALVDRLVGDQAIGLYVPGFAGKDHAGQAVKAAGLLLRATGHESHPWIPVGVGVHTNVAFVGSVGKEGGATDVTVLGDAPNVAARLASSAAAGEILISEQAASAGGVDTRNLERRDLELKGKSVPVTTFVQQVGAHPG